MLFSCCFQWPEWSLLEGATLDSELPQIPVVQGKDTDQQKSHRFQLCPLQILSELPLENYDLTVLPISLLQVTKTAIKKPLINLLNN